jgi:hypothetical protein
MVAKLPTSFLRKTQPLFTKSRLFWMHQGFWSVSDLIHWVDLRGNLQETMVVLKPSLCIAILTLPWVPSGVWPHLWHLISGECGARCPVQVLLEPTTGACFLVLSCWMTDTSAEAWLVTCLEKLGIYIYYIYMCVCIGFWWFLPRKTSEKAYKHYWYNQKIHQLCIFFAASACLVSHFRRWDSPSLG